MTRNLRPRKSKPSYAALASADLEDETVADVGESQATFNDDAESGSDFDPERAHDKEDMGLGNQVEGENSEPDVGEDLDLEQPVSTAGRSTPINDSKNQHGVSKTSSSRVSKRQIKVLPSLSVHHRHRAASIYTRVGRVERLEVRPALFKPWKTIISNNSIPNSRVTDRVNRSWGYNVGCGPLWEMVEDRGWYKEATQNMPILDGDHVDLRPKVYGNVVVMNGWNVLSQATAALYLPTDTKTTEDGRLQPPPPVSCLLGQNGRQTQKTLEMFQAQKMSEVISESTAHVFNAGAPVWGLDWCPIHLKEREARSYKQYLAVAPFPTRSHSPEIGIRAIRPSFACVQIWSFGPSQSPTPLDSQVADSGDVKCELVLCLESGPAYELKWCPLPAHDDSSTSVRPRKLGLLGGVFEDGSWSLYAVPDPADITPEGHDPAQPVYVRIPEPLIRIELEEAACWTFDWANSEVVGIGTTNGVIAVYDIGPHLKGINTSDHQVVTDLVPTHYITVHQSAIRALAWVRAPAATSTGIPRLDGNPTVVVSGGYDGMGCMTDIREGRGSIMNRTRDVINAMAFSPFAGGPVTIDHENVVKAYSASPITLGRGHTLLDPQGPVWSINASDLHPQLAVGSADGSCTTTNSLRSTRRGGSVPFFIHKIYQLDYSRNLGTYRMLEQFFPQETQDRPAAKASAAKNKSPSKRDPKKERIKADSVGTGAWPREVGVHRVTWNSCNGLGASGLLASATAAGLCRIDDLWGRWVKDKVPYGSIEHIRRELDNAMDVDLDSDASA